jgi:DNA replication protein DnaC
VLKGALRGAQTPCALFLGPTGCGKTSAALYLTALAESRTRFVRARDLSNADRRHPLGQGVPPEIERAQWATYLVIDDVGSEGSDLGAIQDVLDLRYSSGSAVIVTTGLTMPELTAHIGGAYVRRIVDQHVRRADGGEFPVLVVDCHD